MKMKRINRIDNLSTTEQQVDARLRELFTEIPLNERPESGFTLRIMDVVVAQRVQRERRQTAVMWLCLSLALLFIIVITAYACVNYLDFSSLRPDIPEMSIKFTDILQNSPSLPIWSVTTIALIILLCAEIFISKKMRERFAHETETKL